MNDQSWRPQWSDPGQYPDPEKATSEQWAWEFLRRMPSYQDAFDNSRYALCSHFWVSALHDYRSNYENLKCESNEFLFREDPYPIAVMQWDVELLKHDPASLEVFLPQAPDEMILIFNLAHDTDSQLKRMKDVIKRAKRERRGWDAPDKNPNLTDGGRFPEYLRIIDCESVGASVTTNEGIAKLTGCSDFDWHNESVRLDAMRKTAMKWIGPTCAYKRLLSVVKDLNKNRA